MQNSIAITACKLNSLSRFLLPTPTEVAGVRLSLTFVCLFLRKISHNQTQLGSPNLTNKCSTMSPGNSFILVSKVQKSRSRIGAGVGGSVHSCECWLLIFTLQNERRLSRRTMARFWSQRFLINLLTYLITPVQYYDDKTNAAAIFRLNKKLKADITRTATVTALEVM